MLFQVLFQFQTGAIRSDIDQGIYGGLRGFQFQTGSIKRVMIFRLPQVNGAGFNSKLVRLKVLSEHDKKIGSACFNSKLVRLKGQGSSLSKGC